MEAGFSKWLVKVIKFAAIFIVAVGLTSVFITYELSERTDLPSAGPYPLKSVKMSPETFWSTPGLVVVFIDEQHRERAVKISTDTVIQTGAENQLGVGYSKATIILKKDTAIDASEQSGMSLNVIGILASLFITVLLWLVFGQDPTKKSA